MGKDRVNGTVTYIRKDGTYKTQSDRMNEIKSLKKQLTSAKRAETKARKEFMLASGSERMSTNPTAKSEREKVTTATHEKYVEAQDKVERLQKKLDKLVRTKDKQAGQLSF